MDCVESADLKCSSSTESRRFHNALCSQCNGKTRSKNSIRRFPSNFSDIMLREFRKKQIITIIINRLKFYLLKKKKDKDRREKREEISLSPLSCSPQRNHDDSRFGETTRVYLLGMILLGRSDPEQGQILGRGGELDGCSDGPSPGVLVIPPARVRITRFTGLPDQFASLNPDLAVRQCLLQREEPPPRLGHPVQKGAGVRRHGRRFEVDQDLLVVQLVRSPPTLGLRTDEHRRDGCLSLLGKSKKK